jgi:hypothetical protein
VPQKAVRKYGENSPATLAIVTDSGGSIVGRQGEAAVFQADLKWKQVNYSTGASGSQ